MVLRSNLNTLIMKKGIFVIALLCIAQIGLSQSAIHVEKIGKGDPIIFLPGFTTPGSVWDETIEHLSANFESHIVYYAGFNGLQAVDTPWYDALKMDLAKYILNENLIRITLIGHSMGGNLAIDLASEFPGRVTGLILVESIPCMRELIMPGVPASSLQYNSQYNNNILDMSKEDFKKMANGMAQMMTNQPSKIEILANWSVVADRKTYVYGYTDLLKLDLRNSLLKISVPTLILGASFPDKDMIKTNYEKQYANLKNKEIILIDNSKHFIMFDQPEQLYSQVNKYLEKNVNRQKAFRNSAQ